MYPEATECFKSQSGALAKAFDHPLYGSVMVFSDTFNNISVTSWCSVLLAEETGVPGENHRPAASHL